MSEDLKDRLVLFSEWGLNTCGALFILEWACRGVMFLVHHGIIN